MEKYFVPGIEDFRVGYEHDQLEDLPDGTRTDKWVKRKIENNYTIHFPSILEDLINGNIRVPYLTKETIEEEGWDNSDGQLHKGNVALKLYDNLGDKQNLHILRIWQESKNGNQLFLGECKDINSFRTIMKLLKIN